MKAQALATALLSPLDDAATQAAKRRSLAKSITLLESTLASDRTAADELLTLVLPHTGRSLRLGISGVPGVGKSTFIEVLGLYLISQGHKLAVLAVDPSSSVSGGSILGDKTRMERLSVSPGAFIRPSPSKGTLGGVAEKTRETILLCEAAGYDVVIVETVGVGQSETAVSLMTDLFVLMQLPNAGDDLQAIKKGVMELADMVLINKADLDPGAATRAQAQIISAMRLYGFHANPFKQQFHAVPDGEAHASLHESAKGLESDHSSQAQGGTYKALAKELVKVLQLSAIKETGVQAFWESVRALQAERIRTGQWSERRRHQALSAMWERVDSELKRSFNEYPSVKQLLPAVLAAVNNATTAPTVAARQLLSAYKDKNVLQ